MKLEVQKALGGALYERFALDRHCTLSPSVARPASSLVVVGDSSPVTKGLQKVRVRKSGKGGSRGVKRSESGCGCSNETAKLVAVSGDCKLV